MGRSPPPGKPETSSGAVGASPKLGGGNEPAAGVVCEKAGGANMAAETDDRDKPQDFCRWHKIHSDLAQF